MARRQRAAPVESHSVEKPHERLWSWTGPDEGELDDENFKRA